MALITRQGKGSKLTIQEMDGNLEYLQSLSATTVVTDYPETSPELAGTRFWYNGNEWHYMTQEEIDSINWTGLVTVGFPAPTTKSFNDYILRNGNTSYYLINYLEANLPGSTFILDFLGLGYPNFVKYSIFFSTGPGGEFTITDIKNAQLLTSLEDIGTKKSIVINYANLTDEIIDDLFTQLPTTTKTATINVSNNPGSATCDPTIATAKGYTVITS